MAKRRGLGHVNHIIRFSGGSAFQQLQDHVNNILSSSVGVLGEFNIDGDVLEANNRSIYIKGNDNYLILDGTDPDGVSSKYYFKIEGGNLLLVRTETLP